MTSRSPTYHLMTRPGYGAEGRRIRLVANHFDVKLTKTDAVFYQYTLTITPDDVWGYKAAQNKVYGRKIVNRLYEIYSKELNNKRFAYDGGSSLFTVGPLPQNNFEFTVVLEDSSARATAAGPGDGSTVGGDLKRSKRSGFMKRFIVGIKFVAKFPMRSIALALRGSEREDAQDALGVLDIILKQQQAERGCLVLRSCYFDGNHTNIVDLAGGVCACRGFHSSFRTTEGGLSLNSDVSTTIIIKPGPVVEFLLENQNIQDPRQIDWAKANRMLKKMKIKAIHNKMEYKVIGISKLACNMQTFSMKERNSEGETQTVEMTVYNYFQNKRNITVTRSASMPCLDVGKPERPCYLPIELCHLLSLQRYTKELSFQRRVSLAEKCSQKPLERMRVIADAVNDNRYDKDPMLNACGVSIDTRMTTLTGRVLNCPLLKVGNMEDCVPRNGRWNFNQKTLLQPCELLHNQWAIVNFSGHCDLSHLSRELIKCARNRGSKMEEPSVFLEEDREWMRSDPILRVEKMFKKLETKFTEPPRFILCVLPERKICPWKRKNLYQFGIVTQCIAPPKSLKDQYLANVLLKINSKLGGINSLLSVECKRSIPLISQTPTMILAMDVSHGPPGLSFPSVAAVVGSRHWPLISRYRASVRIQSPKLEMIDSLYKPGENGDEGMVRDLLLDFYKTNGGMKPAQMIIFRDGVSDSQLMEVLNVELNQIIKVFEHLGDTTMPKFTVIVAQKKHHTRFFIADNSDNVPPGTVVDNTVVHPRNYDFYMCAHQGRLGTSRPIHYDVLLDEIGFAPDDLQKLVHSLSYVNQKGNAAVSMGKTASLSLLAFCLPPSSPPPDDVECSFPSSVAPVCYAHLAARQLSQCFDLSDTSGGDLPNKAGVPHLPELHENVRRSMFFC
ncbi:hypothetical protein OPV22_032839 [Ensete ventricosum]|uniref:Piwi domain-containing protein n=1 Tax=Ensete ventricosum TaxID=4639 RepID=A0AAV8PSJ4_ENSVE|nr:hypothetical protein OPV22_032839 [Ensete ventricosum]